MRRSASCRSRVKPGELVELVELPATATLSTGARVTVLLLTAMAMAPPDWQRGSGRAVRSTADEAAAAPHSPNLSASHSKPLHTNHGISHQPPELGGGPWHPTLACSGLPRPAGPAGRCADAHSEHADARGAVRELKARRAALASMLPPPPLPEHSGRLSHSSSPSLPHPRPLPVQAAWPCDGLPPAV